MAGAGSVLILGAPPADPKDILMKGVIAERESCQQSRPKRPARCQVRLWKPQRFVRLHLGRLTMALNAKLREYDLFVAELQASRYPFVGSFLFRSLSAKQTK